ncbi:MAG: PepSY-like domain-containing protein [Bacteroidia bacterium]
MKNLIIILALSLATGTAYSQQIKESEVPAEVKKSQEQNFPGLKVTKWEKEGANYETEFISNKVETSAEYDAKGILLGTETEINVSELPKTITDYFAKNKPGKKIKEASRIVHPTGDLNYEAEVDGMDYIFDSNGALLRSERDKEKDDDKR